MKGDVRVWQLTGERERESKVMRSLFLLLPQGLLICVVVMCHEIQRPPLFVYVGTLCSFVHAYVGECTVDATQN